MAGAADGAVRARPYYDLDACLAEEERVPVTFLAGAAGLGRELDTTCADDDLPAGSDVEVPCWLVGELLKKNMVAARLPKCFGGKLRADVAAEPAAVKLRVKCPYFFEFGARLQGFLPDPRLGVVNEAYVGRYRDVLCRAHTTADVVTDESYRFVSYLTHEERIIFERGRQSALAFQRWRYTDAERLDMSAVARAAKRRRVAVAADAQRPLDDRGAGGR